MFVFHSHSTRARMVILGVGGGAPWGGGGTDSLSLGTNCETTAPFLDKGQPLVLPSPNLQPPLFMDA